VLVFFAGTPDAASFEPIGVLFGWLAAWVIGSSTARRLEDQDRARRAIRSQVEAEERTRMARELHDVIGHTVNVLIVQAGAARLSLEKDPELARRLLATMEDTGRAALSDLDQVLGTLRPEPAGPRAANGWSPSGSPGLAQLPDLVDRLTASGVDVTLRVDDAVGLPRNLDLSAYRIVQEALTNTLKYAAPCAATVLCSRSGRDVVVEVSDNGPGPARRHRPGRGLLGITERVSMCGGTLEHGAGARGGFTVRAVLPLP